MSPTVARKLVTIVAADSAEEPLIGELLGLGLRGLTAMPVRGRGQHGVRPSTWSSANVQLELILDDVQVAQVLAVLDRLRAHNPIVAWIMPIEAWPADHFEKAT